MSTCLLKTVQGPVKEHQGHASQSRTTLNPVYDYKGPTTQLSTAKILSVDQSGAVKCLKVTFSPTKVFKGGKKINQSCPNVK